MTQRSKASNCCQQKHKIWATASPTNTQRGRLYQYQNSTIAKWKPALAVLCQQGCVNKKGNRNPSHPGLLLAHDCQTQCRMMCVSEEPHAEWHYLHKWLQCLLQRSRVIPDWPLLSKPRHTSHYSRTKVQYSCCQGAFTNQYAQPGSPASPRLFQIGFLLPLQPSLRVPGKHKQLPKSFLRTRPHCKCQMLWKWLKSACHQRTFSYGTIRWKQHSRGWLTRWLFVCRATVRRVMKRLFPSTLFFLMLKHFKRGQILRIFF